MLIDAPWASIRQKSIDLRSQRENGHFHLITDRNVRYSDSDEREINRPVSSAELHFIADVDIRTLAAKFMLEQEVFQQGKWNTSLEFVIPYITV